MTGVSFANLVKLLPARNANQPVLVAVDGGGGSGKSTLAREWAAFDPKARVVALDDFYIPVDDGTLVQRGPEKDYQHCFDLARVQEQVLEPISRRESARYQKLNWGTGQLEGWFEVEPAGIILVEGVYSHRPEWSQYFAFKIWVETPAALRRQRMMARGYNTAVQMDCWQAAEDWYAERFDPKSGADVVIDGITGKLLR